MYKTIMIIVAAAQSSIYHFRQWYLAKYIYIYVFWYSEEKNKTTSILHSYSSQVSFGVSSSSIYDHTHDCMCSGVRLVYMCFVVSGGACVYVCACQLLIWLTCIHCTGSRSRAVLSCAAHQLQASSRGSAQPSGSASSRKAQTSPSRLLDSRSHRRYQIRLRFARRERTRVFSQVESVAGQRRASSHSALRIPLTRSIF